MLYGAPTVLIIRCAKRTLTKCCGISGFGTETIRLWLSEMMEKLSVFDGDRLVAMARMIGDLELDYFIKDVVVRPEYQHRGIGKLLIQELLAFIRQHGIRNTNIFTELCAMPDKIPFYERFGFAANEAQRLKQMIHVD